jgi:hypothetical protein
MESFFHVRSVELHSTQSETGRSLYDNSDGAQTNAQTKCPANVNSKSQIMLVHKITVSIASAILCHSFRNAIVL